MIRLLKVYHLLKITYNCMLPGNFIAEKFDGNLAYNVILSYN